jgi:hypothetical protein
VARPVKREGGETLRVYVEPYCTVYAGVKLLENDAEVDRKSSYNSWTLGAVILIF